MTDLERHLYRGAPIINRVGDSIYKVYNRQSYLFFYNQIGNQTRDYFVLNEQIAFNI